jgi:hypothetical protein
LAGENDGVAEATYNLHNSQNMSWNDYAKIVGWFA